MKEVKHLSCVQAVLLLHIIFILDMIQEYSLRSELAFNNYSHLSLKCYLLVFINIVIV